MMLTLAWFKLLNKQIIKIMRQILAITIYIFLSSFLYAQGPNFEVAVSTDSVLLGNYIEVSFTLSNGAMEEFQPPVFDGFKILSGPNQSTSISMVNGTTSQTASYSYYLEPSDIGNYFIPPARVIAEDIALETKPIEILVVPNPDGIIQQPKPKNDFFGGGFFDRQDFFSRDLFGQQAAPTKPIRSKKKRKVYRL